MQLSVDLNVPQLRIDIDQLQAIRGNCFTRSFGSIVVEGWRIDGARGWME